jgi:hypothetical protein
MFIKGLIDEDFVNYKKPSMYIAFSKCDFKCDREAGCSVCQNSDLARGTVIDIQYHMIVSRYIHNPITKAIVMAGLEPLEDYEDLYCLIEEFREVTNDDIVIYTGYTEDELESTYFNAHLVLEELADFPNIIIKFGRFIPNQEKHYDEVLGVELASPNQYARRIS